MQTEITSSHPLPQDIYDLAGQTFGTITVLSLDHILKGRRFWNCRCVCGADRILVAYQFKEGSQRAPQCKTCRKNAMTSDGTATPDWLIALGFDLTFLQRFWSKVEKTETCWLWMAATNGNGYGSIAAKIVDRKPLLIAAHRASWIIENKALVPDGMNMLHRCDVRRCVRPDHLFLGTIQDNSDDMIAKGREKHVQGEAHPNSIFTDAQVKQIRELYAQGNTTYKDLANQFHCSASTIAWIIRGNYWRHLLW